MAVKWTRRDKALLLHRSFSTPFLANRDRLYYIGRFYVEETKRKRRKGVTGLRVVIERELERFQGLAPGAVAKALSQI